MIGEAIVEFVIKVVAEVAVLMIFRYPGAFYLWILSLGRRSYDHWFNCGDGMLAGTIGILGTAALIAVLIAIT
jgi:hypothetical protein